MGDMNSVGRASHRYRGGHGFEPVEALIFFRLLLSSCLSWKFTAMIILYLHLQPHYKNDLFIYTTNNLPVGPRAHWPPQDLYNTSLKH